MQENLYILAFSEGNSLVQSQQQTVAEHTDMLKYLRVKCSYRLIQMRRILTVNNLFIALLSWKISSQFGTNLPLSKAPSSPCFWRKQEKQSFKLQSRTVFVRRIALFWKSKWSGCDYLCVEIYVFGIRQKVLNKCWLRLLHFLSNFPHLNSLLCATASETWN